MVRGTNFFITGELDRFHLLIVLVFYDFGNVKVQPVFMPEQLRILYNWIVTPAFPGQGNLIPLYACRPCAVIMP
jgi:hypothetical protein